MEGIQYLAFNNDRYLRPHSRRVRDTAVPITCKPEIACKHLISVASARSRWKHVNPRLTKIDDPGSDSDRIDVLCPSYPPGPGRARVTHAGSKRARRLCVAARDVTPTRAYVYTGRTGRMKGGRGAGATRRNHRWLPFITPRSKHGPESGPLGWLTRNDDSPAVRDALDHAAPRREEVRVCVREGESESERTASPKSAGDTRTTRSARDYAVDRFEEAGVSRGAR